MRELHGVGIGNGVGVGPVLRMPNRQFEPLSIDRETNPYDEQQLVATAFAMVAMQLRARGSAAGGEAKGILDAQAMMAEDPVLLADVNNRIAAGCTGERAVFDAAGAIQVLLTELGGLMGERAEDLADVAKRVIAALRGAEYPGLPSSDVPVVIVASSLAPADAALLDPKLVAAIVLSEGGPTSHTAILARAKSIPCLVGVSDTNWVPEGVTVLVDAATGIATIEPTPTEIATATERSSSRPVAAHACGALADGERILLLANVASQAEARHALDMGAEGVGLLRSEFLFLNAQNLPTVEQQCVAYREVLDIFAGKPVIVRCLDAGADKRLPLLTADDSALGVRGIRAFRTNERVLRDQLLALALAQRNSSAHLAVMAPMVADLQEAEYFVQLAKEFGIQTAGVMAEIPAVALMADEVVTAADFVSIGTNDLTQFTLAADRMIGALSAYQNPWHPAVLRLVKMLGDAGAASGTPIGVCGEAAADPLLAVVLVGLGATSLSMAPSALADVRAELALHTRPQVQRMAAAAISASSATAARAAAEAIKN